MTLTPVTPLIVAELSADRMDTTALIDLIRRDDCGALVSFEGTVRSPNQGQVVLRLEYEAYERVAAGQMHQIAEEVCEEFGLSAALIVHRIGTVGVGEPAVLAVTVSPHRHDAFHGTHRLIDRVKAEVAIWKREVMAEGAHWVEEK